MRVFEREIVRVCLKERNLVNVSEIIVGLLERDTMCECVCVCMCACVKYRG